MSTEEPARRPAHGVPGPVDVLLDASRGRNLTVFKCRVCNTRIPGAPQARDHSCREPVSCPTCDSLQGRVTRGIHGRVDVCECGTIINAGDRA